MRNLTENGENEGIRGFRILTSVRFPCCNCWKKAIESMIGFCSILTMEGIEEPAPEPFPPPPRTRFTYGCVGVCNTLRFQSTIFVNYSNPACFHISLTTVI